MIATMSVQNANKSGYVTIKPPPFTEGGPKPSAVVVPLPGLTTMAILAHFVEMCKDTFRVQEI